MIGTYEKKFGTKQGLSCLAGPGRLLTKGLRKHGLPSFSYQAYVDFQPGPTSRHRYFSVFFAPLFFPPHDRSLTDLLFLKPEFVLYVTSLLLDFSRAALPLYLQLCAPEFSRVLASRKKNGEFPFRRGTEPIPFFLVLPRFPFPHFCEPRRRETCEPHPHACGLRLGEKGLSHFSFLGRASYHHLLRSTLYNHRPR